MPANGRWDLIRRLKVKRQVRHMFHVSIDTIDRPNMTLKYIQTFTE